MSIRLAQANLTLAVRNCTGLSWAHALPNVRPQHYPKLIDFVCRRATFEGEKEQCLRRRAITRKMGCRNRRYSDKTAQQEFEGKWCVLHSGIYEFVRQVKCDSHVLWLFTLLSTYEQIPEDFVCCCFLHMCAMLFFFLKIQRAPLIVKHSSITKEKLSS